MYVSAYIYIYTYIYQLFINVTMCMYMIICYWEHITSEKNRLSTFRRFPKKIPCRPELD